MFTLPWLRFVLGFLTMMLIMALIAAAFTHYVYGGLQLQARGEKTTRAARTHLAVLLAGLVIVRAGTYWVDRYSLATKDSKLITGITYTDAHAVLPTKAILAVAAVMTRGALHRLHLDPLVAAAGGRRRPAHDHPIVVGGIYPALVPELQGQAVGEVARARLHRPQHQGDTSGVRPGSTRMQTQPTRRARPPPATSCATTPTPSPGSAAGRPHVVSPTFKQLQAVKSYYQFPDVLDVDRYRSTASCDDTVIAVRELDLDGLPADQRNWINDHTVYTHGFGVVAAYGNRRGDDGQPVFYQQNIPPVGPLGTFEPRIYFGESSPDYSIVGGPTGSRRRRSSTTRTAARPGREHHVRRQGGVACGEFVRPPGCLRDQVPRAEDHALGRRERPVPAAVPPHAA